MKNYVIILALAIVFVTGCNEPGMNVKKASADAGAGVAVVGALEAVNIEHFEATKTNIVIISSDLLKFLDSGQLINLPIDTVRFKLEAFLISKGYGEYNYIVDAALQYVKSQSVDVTIVGTDNLELIRIALKETIRNAERCTAAGRTEWKKDERRMKQLSKEKKISEVK